MNQKTLMAIPFLLILAWRCHAQAPVVEAGAEGAGERPPQFRIRKETTYFTEPVLPSGYPNYEEALHRRLSKGIKPELNRIAALARVMGPKTPEGRPFPSRFYEKLGIAEPDETGTYFQTLSNFLKQDESLTTEERNEIYVASAACGSRPWKKEEYPQVAAWIESNREPCRRALLASEKPQYYHPIVGTSKAAPGSIEGAKSLVLTFPAELVNSWTYRAMMELGQKDHAAAKRTLLSSLRFVRSLKSSVFMSDGFILDLFESIIYTKFLIILETADFTANELKELQLEISSLRQLNKLLETTECVYRTSALDAIIKVNREGAVNQLLIHILFSDHESVKKLVKQEDRNIPVPDFDHERNLIEVNQWFDRLVNDLRLSDPPARRAALKRTHFECKEKVAAGLKQFEEEQSKTPKSDAVSSKRVGSLFGLKWSEFVISGIVLEQETADSAEVQRRLLLISLALARFRKEKGEYPESLAKLAPAFINEIPMDIFSGRAPGYTKTPENGYLLYSVGRDGIDSGGHSREEDRKSDDIAIRVPRPTEK